MLNALFYNNMHMACQKQQLGVPLQKKKKYSFLLPKHLFTKLFDLDCKNKTVALVVDYL